MFDILKELEKFSSDILLLNTSIDEKEISIFEEKYTLLLPSDYKILLRKYNGVNLCGVGIYGIKEVNGSYSLEDCYLFEHNETDNPMPLYLVPFSPDGGGNHYCFDTRLNDEISCPIVFWQHDYQYSDGDSPDVVNINLAEWIKEVMIDWTLEDYNYDGIEK